MTRQKRDRQKKIHKKNWVDSPLSFRGKIDIGWFLDLPDMRTKFDKIGPAVLEEFGNKNRYKRILHIS